jgi:single-stranded DNA-binding protein
MAKKEKEVKQLVQTKSAFTFKGIVDGMGNENAWREDSIGKGKNKGRSYRAIRFLLQTSKFNKLSVELFGMEQEFVYPYSKAEKKSMKVPFAKRDNLPKGYHLIGINVGLEQNDGGKNIRKSLADYDAAEYIWENLNDGDSVTVSGEVTFSTYENSEGELINQTKYAIKNIYREKQPIDFDVVNEEGESTFEEVNAFEQEVVFVGSEFDKDEGAVYVTGYTIQYGNKFTPAKFVIRPEGNKNIEKTANAFVKKMKGGDFVKVYGIALNKAETIEIDSSEVEDNDDDIFGGEKPKGLGKSAITSYVNELRITGADGSTYEKGLYDLDTDFVIEELVEEENINFGSDEDDDEIDFGGKPVDISDDDLPF